MCFTWLIRYINKSKREKEELRRIDETIKNLETIIGSFYWEESLSRAELHDDLDSSDDSINIKINKVAHVEIVQDKI